jgi:hypothetical protein
MTKKILWIVALAQLLGTTLRAQEIVGDWQGTLQVTISYCGHVASGSRFTIGCEPEIGTMGRRYGLPTVIWQE